MKTYIQTVSLALLSLIVGAGLTSCTVVQEPEPGPPHSGPVVHHEGYSSRDPREHAAYEQEMMRRRNDPRHTASSRDEVVRESRSKPRPRPRPDVRNGGVVRRVNARTGEVEELGYMSEGELTELPTDKTYIRGKEDAVIYKPETGNLRGDAPSHLNPSEVDDMLRKRSMNRGKQVPQAPAHHAHSPAPARAASRVPEAPCPSDGVTDAAIEETVEEDPLPFKADPVPAPTPKKAVPKKALPKKVEEDQEEEIPPAPLSPLYRA